MSRRTEQAIANCNLIIEVLERTRSALPELVRRSRFAARDGYPSSSLPAGGRGSSRPSSVETTALSRPIPDPVADAIRNLLRALEDMAREANAIESRRRLALENPEMPFKACINCSRAMPISGDGRCDACYRYRRRTGQDRVTKATQARP